MRDVQMAYALDAHGFVARAESAPKAPDAAYSCLDCGERLKLRRGPVLSPHFSHLNDTNCTGEGVVHRAAKLELRLALERRERPFTLEVPCCWPGCQVTVPLAFDRMLGGYTHAVNEQTYQVDAGEFIRFDVATLLHGSVQVGLEVYHHHRVPLDRVRKALPNWAEVHAQPLLDDPYRLVMVKNDLDVSPTIEAFRFNPDLVQQVPDFQTLHQYRARGSGRWIEEGPRDEDVDIDEFQYYTCFNHTLELERLETLWWENHLAERAAEETEDAAPSREDPLARLMRHMTHSAGFAARFYAARGVPPAALKGVSLRACRCPKCGERSVFVMSSFVPRQQLAQFRGLLSLTPGDGEWRLLTHCGQCRAVVRRSEVQEAAGVDLPGDLVVALLSPASAGSEA